MPIEIPNVLSGTSGRIDNHGQVAVTIIDQSPSRSAYPFNTDTVIWRNGQTLVIPPVVASPNDYATTVTGNINNQGIFVVGAHYIKDGLQGQVNLLWQDGVTMPVPDDSRLGGPNDLGQFYGNEYNQQNPYPILAQSGAVVNLNNYIPSDWYLREMSFINNRGEIVALGYRNGGPEVPVVVRPTGVPLFGDIPADDPAASAIAALNARSIIRGCDVAATPPFFCPDESTLRAQMAALIVRAIPGWSSESYPNTFTDKGVVDDELWKRVATLQHYGVANGYNDCSAVGLVAPCYGPTDPVNRAQAISFVTRALVKKGYWADQPIDATLYGGALIGTGHEQDASTYWHYTQAKGGVPDYPKAGSFPVTQAAPRGWFARLLWTALQDTPAAGTTL